MPASNRLGDLIQGFRRRSGHWLSLGLLPSGVETRSIEEWCDRLLSGAGEASAIAIATIILEYWHGLDDAGRREFLDMLALSFGVDADTLSAAIRVYQEAPSELAAAALHHAAEPRRQELFRRLNLAEGGVSTLVRMREDLLRRQANGTASYAAIDADFAHLFSSWFNRGFLDLQRIDWNTPASILEKIIRYEAVHAIRSWDDLRRRLQPEDRRCYAFFHPRLPDEPLIFVEVALTESMPAAIAPLLAEDRTPVAAREATHAVFYSISNCQKGLRGISFGNFLIKQVVQKLSEELLSIRHFVTLSPVPRFAAWLQGEPDALPAEAAEVRRLVQDAGWSDDDALRDRLCEILPPLAARYFLSSRDGEGRILDPVARFHLGNGAALARINCFGDMSPAALDNQLGLMVNYRYELGDVEGNHERFASEGKVAAEPAVHALLPERRSGIAGTWQRFQEAAF
jgi:malonyl-CoA decarboxylase